MSLRIGSLSWAIVQNQATITSRIRRIAPREGFEKKTSPPDCRASVHYRKRVASRSPTPSDDCSGTLSARLQVSGAERIGKTKAVSGASFGSRRARNPPTTAGAMHRSNRSTFEGERGQQAQASSSCGGARAGASSTGSEGKPRWRRIRRIALESMHDGGHETHAATAVGAHEHIDVEAAAHELGPGTIILSGLGMCARRRLRHRLRPPEANDLAPPFGVRRELAVIDDQANLGARNQSRELFEQLLRFEDDVIGTGRLSFVARRSPSRISRRR